MADIKISALPSAAESPMLSEFPINVSGVTSRQTKNDFLIAAAGEDMFIQAAVGQLCGVYGNPGFSGLTVTNDDSIQITALSSIEQLIDGIVDDNIIRLDAAVGCEISIDQNLRFRVNASGGNHIIDYQDNLHLLKIGYPYAVDIRYAAATPGNWLTSAPGDVWTAIDRLAACFTANSLIKP